MRAAIYARSAVKDDLAVRHQVFLCVDAAESMGWSIDPQHIYCDAGISGLEFEHREGLNQLLANSRLAPVTFDRVLVADAFRLGRDFVRVLNILNDLQTRGITVYLACNNGVKTLGEVQL
jgi:DNA invertase Pin-like site-specific DNA recombinase